MIGDFGKFTSEIKASWQYFEKSFEIKENHLKFRSQKRHWWSQKLLKANSEKKLIRLISKFQIVTKSAKAMFASQFSWSWQEIILLSFILRIFVSAVAELHPLKEFL